MLLPASKRYVLPVLSALISFALFQLALHHPIDARAFSSLEIPSIITPNEYEGVYAHLLARFVASIIGSPEPSFRILTALATGFSVYFLQKLFPQKDSWSIVLIIANISFLYFACHSPHAMMVILLFSAFLATWESDKATNLAMAGLVASLTLGFDSLLAAALILYTLVRIVTSRAGKKHELTALLAMILGVTVWLLLAYMMFAAENFLEAVSLGFKDLFAQVNPINFGVGLLVTFNLLLIWVFRSATEKTNTKYLGSLLIVLFLFIRVEPAHLVLLLILGVSYLQKTGGLPKQRWIQPAIAVLNIAAFFLLPPVMPLEAAYNVRAPKPSDAQLYYASYFSLHDPSYHSLIDKGDMLEASRRFVGEKDSVDVILDPSLETAFNPAALRSASSHRAIGGFNVKFRRFETVFGRDTSFMATRSGTLRYLTADALPTPTDSLLTAIRAPRIERDGVRYYTIDSSQFGAFFDSYIYHHYLSFH